MKAIYTAWWQGFDNAPDAIRICHQSLVNAIKELDIELVSITYKNLDDYTDLPGLLET